MWYYSNANVQELYDRYYGDILTSPSVAVAFQASLWELLGQTAVADYELLRDDATKTLALSMVDAVYNGTDTVTKTYELSLWSNADYQDLFQVSPIAVPEPGAGFLALLGGLGFMLRRRRK